MHFSVSAIFAFATSCALVAAQLPDLTGVPTCALPCFATAVQGSGCGITDVSCQCTTGRESITNSLFSCTPSRCSTDEIASIAPAVQNLCRAAGVTISDVPTQIPSSIATSGITGSATRSASVTPTGSAAPAQTTNAAPGLVAGVGAVAMGLVGVLAL